jgi:hypothetical protein
VKIIKAFTTPKPQTTANNAALKAETTWEKTTVSTGNPAVKKLENLVVQVEPSEEQGGGRLTFKLLLQTVELSGAVS